MGDGFYTSKDPTNSIKVLKENLQRKNQTNGQTHRETCRLTIRVATAREPSKCTKTQHAVSDISVFAALPVRLALF